MTLLKTIVITAAVNAHFSRRKESLPQIQKQWDYELFGKRAKVRDCEANVESPVRKMNTSNVLHNSVQQKSTALCVLSGYPRAVFRAISQSPELPPTFEPLIYILVNSPCHYTNHKQLNR
jgi:hypothetical protein